MSYNVHRSLYFILHPHEIRFYRGDVCAMVCYGEIDAPNYCVLLFVYPTEA